MRLRETAPVHYFLISHAVCDVGVAWCDCPKPLVLRIFLGNRRQLVESIASRYPQAEETYSKQWAGLRDGLLRYLDGDPVDFDPSDFALEQLTEFEQNVLQNLMAVPRGTVVSYGELARKCGCPNGARAIGSVMSKNPFPIVYPCHRVVKAGGRLGNFQPGVNIKKGLLRLEKVDLSTFRE